MAPTLVALQVRIEDCLIWRATCDADKQAEDADVVASMLDLKTFGNILIATEGLCSSLERFCREITARAHVRLPLASLRKVPRCNAAIESLWGSLHDIATENQIDLPTTNQQDRGQLPFATAPVMTLDQWLAKIFELAPEALVVGTKDEHLRSKSGPDGTDSDRGEHEQGLDSDSSSDDEDESSDDDTSDNSSSDDEASQ